MIKKFYITKSMNSNVLFIYTKYNRFVEYSIKIYMYSKNIQILINIREFLKKWKYDRININ